MASNKTIDIVKIIGVLASIATILGLCCAAIALIPAFGQWFMPHAPIPNPQPSNKPITTDANPPAVQAVPTQAPPIPSVPTSSPALPASPAPTSTDIIYVSPPKNNTSAGLVLAQGETWEKDGFGVTLTKVEPGIPGIRFHFIFENTTQSDIYFEFDTGKVTVVDNNGIVYPHSRKCKTQISLRSGKTDEWITTYCPGGDEFQSDFYNPSIQYFIVTLNGIGRIDNAVWKIPIPR